MKKRILSIILVISCLLLITGCGKKDSASEQESVQGDEAAQEEAVSGADAQNEQDKVKQDVSEWLIELGY